MFYFIFNSQIFGNQRILEKIISDQSYMDWKGDK